MEIKIKIDAPGLTEAITKLAYAISQSGNAPQITATPIKGEQAGGEAKTPEAEAPTTSPVKEETKAEPTITLETVRVKLTELAQAGKQAQVKTLISSLGANKLSDVPQDKYAELLEKASEL